MEDRVIHSVFPPVEVSIMIEKCTKNICSTTRVRREELHKPGQHQSNMNSSKVAKPRGVNSSVFGPPFDDTM